MKKIICLFICSLFIFTGCGADSYFEVVDSAKEVPVASGEAESSGIISATTIFVQVAGAVKYPGVYELPCDSRVFSAIEAAGGLLEEADDSDINQAEVLSDGQKLLVFTKAEREKLEAEMEASVNEGEADGLININTATTEELLELPGIGKSKAEAVVEYRESNGAFSSIEDIKNVSGIGDKLYSRIESKIKI